MKILVMSCDKNEDLFYPFFYCMEKYWPEHPEIYYSTETITNPYYKTINKDYDLLLFTKRLRETIQLIDDDYILVMCDDLFVRERVDNNLIMSLPEYFDKTTAAINFENHFDNNDISLDSIVAIRNQNGKYKTSLMIQLWNKEKLLAILHNLDTDPWTFERLNNHLNYRYLINANSHKGLINFGKVDNEYNWGVVQGKWTEEVLSFFDAEKIHINSQRPLQLKKVFGIISYFPWEQPARKQRQDRLDRLVKQLSNLCPDIPIMVISQQWKNYTLEDKCKNQIIKYDYPKLGILAARQELRKHFLESNYDYLIMFDDDAIIDGTLGMMISYMQEIEKHPEGFCFIKGKGSSPYTEYADSQLNLCAISRWIYEREPIPDIDPQKSQAFEDRIWSTLLHFKYADYEFDAPEGLKCIHFKNPNEVAPSTWSREKHYEWKQMRTKTCEIEKYISENKELPLWLLK